MTKVEATAAFALLSYYAKAYSLKYGKEPTINKYKEKWAAASILDDYDVETAKNVIDYYFKLSKDGHPLNWLLNNFEDVLQSYTSALKDEKIREERRKETARLRQEWLSGNA